MHPFVSVITPTYNRRFFLPQLLRNFKNQDYPKNRMELIILDDSEDSNADIFQNEDNVRYIKLDEKMKLSDKRNKLNKLAKGEIIVAMDDDDYYPPDRVSHAVTNILHHKVNLAGSSRIFIYFTKFNVILAFGPYGKYHSTNGTFAFRKEYTLKQQYQSGLDKTEESSFTRKFSEPLVQLDPMKSILCMAHDQNTVDKFTVLKKNKMLERTNLKLEDFIKDKESLDFYKSIMNHQTGVDDDMEFDF